MPVFSYTAIGRDGKTIKGKDFSETRAALESKLKSQKLVLVEARERRSKALANKVLASLIQQLARLVESGVVIDRALQIIDNEARDEKLKTLTAQLRQAIKRGQSLSQAFAELGVMDPLVVPMIKAAESSGQMAEILNRLRLHFEDKAKLKRDIGFALLYPAILVVASLGALLVLGLFVMPVFKELLADRFDQLGWYTRFIFSVSDFLGQYGLALALVLTLMFLGISFAYRRNLAWREKMHRFVLRLGWFGDLLARAQAANILGIWAVLLRSGVSLTNALELSFRVTNLIPFTKALEKILGEVRRGQKLSKAIDHHFLDFPTSARPFILLGEETGDLAGMCQRGYDLLVEDVQNRLKILTNLLPVVILLIMALTVGSVVISTLLAVYSISAI